MIVPGPHETHLHPRRPRRLHRLAVLGHAERRILRRHRDRHQLPDAGHRRLREDVRDVGPPVAHADVHRRAAPSARSERARLGAGDLGQRRAPADGARSCARISSISSGDGGRPPRTRVRYSGMSSSDSGRPVREQQDGLHGAAAVTAVAACTCSTTALTFSTGVPGRMPWPRLKTWPGPAAGAPQHVVHAARAGARAGRAAASDRGCPGRPRRRRARRPALVERRAPVDADRRCRPPRAALRAGGRCRCRSG